ncbi:hypothetical protein [Arcanobacterium canis]
MPSIVAVFAAGGEGVQLLLPMAPRIGANKTERAFKVLMTQGGREHFLVRVKFAGQRLPHAFADFISTVIFLGFAIWSNNVWLAIGLYCVTIAHWSLRSPLSNQSHNTKEK